MPVAASEFMGLTAPRPFGILGPAVADHFLLAALEPAEMRWRGATATCICKFSIDANKMDSQQSWARDLAVHARVTSAPRAMSA